MISETEILERKLNEVRDILLELEFLKKDILTIVDDKEEYFEELVKKSRFLYRLYLNYIRLFIIDLHKLIDGKEDFNMLSIINFCDSNIKRIKWHRNLSSAELNHLRSDFDNVSKYFHQISLLRNKYYAHNDKNKKQFQFKITLEEFWIVLTTLQKIFTKINLHHNNLQWIFDIQYQGTDLIKNAYKFKKVSKLYYSEAVNPNVKIDIIKIRDIMRS